MDMIILSQVSLRKPSRTAFLQVDQESGFNLLQEAVFKGKYDNVLKAHGLLDKFLEEMEFVKTGNNTKVFPGKTAVDTLSSHLLTQNYRKTDREQYTRSNVATARLPTLVKPAETLERD